MPMVFPATHIQTGPGYANLDANRQAVQTILGSIAMLEEAKKRRANEAVLSRLAGVQSPQQAQSVLGQIAAERTERDSGIKGVLNRLNPLGTSPDMTDVEQQITGSRLGAMMDPNYDYRQKQQQSTLGRIAAETEAAFARANYYNNRPEKPQTPANMSQKEAEYYDSLPQSEKATYWDNRNKNKSAQDPNQKRNDQKLKLAGDRVGEAYKSYLRIRSAPSWEYTPEERTASMQQAKAEYDIALKEYDTLSREAEEPGLVAQASPLGESITDPHEFDSPHSALNQPKSEIAAAGKRTGRKKYAGDSLAFENLKSFIRRDPKLLTELDAYDFSPEQLADLKQMMGN